MLSQVRFENNQITRKFASLCEFIVRYPSALVAFSGGCDSALVSFITSRLIKTLCVVGASPTLPTGELEFAEKFCRRYRIKYKIISHAVLSDSNFVSNTLERCYYCKTLLYREMRKLRDANGYAVIFDGTNADDLTDYRPGRRAAIENGVISPLAETKITKSDVRIISAALGLLTANKPVTPCLSSRIAYGIKITPEILSRIDAAEQLIRKHGYSDVRVRYHGAVARIELGKRERIDLRQLRSIGTKIKQLGFQYVTLDLEGYRTGSLNTEIANCYVSGNLNLDLNRAERTDIPEVVMARFKDSATLFAAVDNLLSHQKVLVTKCSPEQLRALRSRYRDRIQALDKIAGIVIICNKVARTTQEKIGTVAIVSAGSADYFVAEEAAISAEYLGLNVKRFYDCGVAGLHRTHSAITAIQAEKPDVIIAVAGMDGALPSVIAGLVRQPVIAVPTSVGYGTNLSGLSALLTMLNSCAPGISVVNIDNGFGAAVCARKMIKFIKENINPLI